MITKLSSLKSDCGAEREGAWIELEGLPGVRAKVRSQNFQPFVDARAQLTRKLAIQFPQTPVPDDVIARQLGALMAEHLVLSWEGFDEAYTPELARQVIADPAHRMLRDLLTAAAATVGAPKVERTEDGAES